MSTTRQLVEEALFESAVTIKLRKKDLLKWPSDDEHLHQYRISIRVARSLVKFLKPYQQKAQNQQLKDTLKTLQDPTSRMRELDVLVPLLADYPALQERVQRESGQVLSYHLIGESGPDHAKTFQMEVQLNGSPLGTGSGRSKKEAEQAAARAALEALEEEP